MIREVTRIFAKNMGLRVSWRAFADRKHAGSEGSTRADEEDGTTSSPGHRRIQHQLPGAGALDAAGRVAILTTVGRGCGAEVSGRRAVAAPLLRRFSHAD